MLRKILRKMLKMNWKVSMLNTRVPDVAMFNLLSNKLSLKESEERTCGQGGPDTPKTIVYIKEQKIYLGID